MVNSTPGMTRRRFLGQMAATTAVAVAAHTGTVEAAPSNLLLQADDVGTTSFMNWDAIEDTPIEAVINEYQQRTGRTVEVIPTPGRGTDYETKVRTMLAGGTAPDIMRTNDDFVRYYSIKDQIIDLTPYIERDQIDPNDYFEPIWNFAKQPSGTYTAWSLGSQPRLIFYNVDMFNEAGVPLPPKEWTAEGWSWDDFLEKAQQLTVEGERWGALVYDDTGYEQTFSVNNGAEDGIYAADGETFTLSSPEGIEAIQWVADLTCEHGVQPEWGLVSEPDTGNNLFLQGKVGMIFRTQGTINYFRRNAGDFEWDVAPPPAKVNQKTESSLICFTITKVAENPDGAWELLKFMGGPDGSKIFASRGAFVPAFKESAELIQAEGEPPDSYPANIQLFAEAPEHNTAVNFTENTENARNVYRPQLELVYTCETTAEEVLTSVEEEVESILSGEF
jgi:multiple sugar transport system substrate-binding protein